MLVIDDVLATGGTAAATVALLERCGAEVVGLSFLVELEALGVATSWTGTRSTSSSQCPDLGRIDRTVTGPAAARS